MNHRRLHQLGTLLIAWIVVAVPVAVLVFADSTKQTAVAGHDAVISPTFDGYATLDLGPYLPNLRYPTDRTLGAHIDFGKTSLTSYEALIDRYTVIGAQPEGEIAKIVAAMRGMAVDSATSGALAGLAGPALWLMLGSRRRAELFRHVTLGRAGIAAVALVVLAAAVFQPWDVRDESVEQSSNWRAVGEELPDVPIPEQAEPLEVEAGLFTSGTKRIATSLMDSYSKGFAFYNEVVEEAVPEVEQEFRRPEDGETVALLVSDRHDNVGMDKVARAIADAAGATVLLDAGDDTSTGSSWEAFSLDSLDRVFSDFDHRFAVTGNHDHGDFVGEYLAERGFERFEDGEAAEGPDDILFLGADDPRSSGLGSWRDETGLSFREHAERVADRACEYDEEGRRIATLLVHDANTGKYALERGCVDLVAGGHVHQELGPTEFVGDNGKIGYSYTTGTTGGAAYAIAIGSKPRRNAMVTLITYRDARPVGVQSVTIRTVGDVLVGPYLVLDPPPGDPEAAVESAAGDDREPLGEPSPRRTDGS
jgi:hypothetical protein